jgi:hypothetical protein
MSGGGRAADSVNTELLTLTYGAMVSQLIRDYEDPAEVNVQLEAMGYNIGVRVVDEFCAKSRGVRCRNFRETIDTVARDAFKMFLGVSAVVTEVGGDGSSAVLRIPDNPLAGAFFVLLPPFYIIGSAPLLACVLIPPFPFPPPPPPTPTLHHKRRLCGAPCSL